MAYSVSKSTLVTVAPMALRQFYLYCHEYIDCLHFLLDPGECVTLAPVSEYISEAAIRFSDAGWDGDGDIQLLWLPSFVFPLNLNIAWEGIILWHVKQLEDGISWLLSPIELPFEDFRGQNRC